MQRNEWYAGCKKYIVEATKLFHSSEYKYDLCVLGGGGGIYSRKYV
jgi:hypothetical protein